jgi:SEC-C motif-containing protein
MQPAPTAEALMRSRYTAYTRGATDYLLRTWHPRSRPPGLDLDPELEWTGLTVLSAVGGLLDLHGEVRFEARYRDRGRPGVLSEHSTFVREDGTWWYVGPR